MNPVTPGPLHTPPVGVPVSVTIASATHTTTLDALAVTAGILFIVTNAVSDPVHPFIFVTTTI